MKRGICLLILCLCSLAFYPDSCRATDVKTYIGKRVPIAEPKNLYEQPRPLVLYIVQNLWAFCTSINQHYPRDTVIPRHMYWGYLVIDEENYYEKVPVQQIMRWQNEKQERSSHRLNNQWELEVLIERHDRGHIYIGKPGDAPDADWLPDFEEEPVTTCREVRNNPGSAHYEHGAIKNLLPGMRELKFKR